VEPWLEGDDFARPRGLNAVLDEALERPTGKPPKRKELEREDRQRRAAEADAMREMR